MLSGGGFPRSLCSTSIRFPLAVLSTICTITTHLTAPLCNVLFHGRTSLIPIPRLLRSCDVLSPRQRAQAETAAPAALSFSNFQRGYVPRRGG